MERVLTSLGLLSVCWRRMETLKGRAAGATGVLGKCEGLWRVSGRSALICPPARGTALWALVQASPIPGQCLSMPVNVGKQWLGEQDGASPGAVTLCWRACQQGIPAAAVSAEGCPPAQRELSAARGLGVSLPRGVELHSHGFSFLSRAGGGILPGTSEMPGGWKTAPGPSGLVLG